MGFSAKFYNFTIISRWHVRIYNIVTSCLVQSEDNPRGRRNQGWEAIKYLLKGDTGNNWQKSNSNPGVWHHIANAMQSQNIQER
jgi:hypothetical protein